ncbi:PrsW family glutamic-type intramembrane protease [Streptococcus iners]|uniref:PrsW family glutamic-type intramembrane protease n=1 Tax=Streptococcus iners subsp. hyiners TaxID=3028083 RepID=A0AA96VRG1_9STRE|nr:PrsW family glutamic-type intramembrane protease [Streptococcus sp. 29892]MCK4029091.1 PrsW family intramembrane metalloprotease [Streptococcus suis]WNY49874.1 PrsW family glutamic-type intramembrane protease [Streptococcus sp. 29892]
MKHLWNTYKSQFALILASLGFVSGCKMIFDELAKPNGMEAKYPLFLLTISVAALYIIPLVYFISYLEKRYAISNKVSHLSWILGLTAGVAFSDYGHTAIGYFLLEIVKVSDDFRYDWGAAVSAPFAEEFGKALVVVLVLLIARKMTLKYALVSGIIAGLSFQIVEDIMFTFRDMFIGKLDGFETIIGRVGQAGWTHWVFTMLFAVGMVALFTKQTAISKVQGVLWIAASIGLHFFFNSPLHTDILTTLLPMASVLLGLLAYRTVDTFAE